MTYREGWGGTGGGALPTFLFAQFDFRMLPIRTIQSMRMGTNPRNSKQRETNELDYTSNE